jgi:hypothetical protein
MNLPTPPPSMAQRVATWPATTDSYEAPATTALSQRSALAWQEAEANIVRVMSRINNWDGHGSLAPNRECAEEARRFLHAMFESARHNHPASVQWMAPNISSNEIGEITLEWWYKNRDVTIFIREDMTITFLKSWGTHIYEEMEEGLIFSMDDVRSLSEWLRG